MLQRIKRAFEAGKTAAAEVDDQPVTPLDHSAAPADPGAELKKPPTPEPALLALLILCDVGPAAPEITRKHLAKAKSSGRRALFIVDARSEIHFFSDRTLLCEYLPSHEDIFRATEERADVISLYRQHRLQLILDKWRVNDCHWIGNDAADLVAQTKANAQRPVRFHEIDLRA